MKKFVTLLIFALVLVGGVYADKVAVISKVQGDVLIQKAEDFDYDTPVTMGMILDNNDQIKVNDGFAVMLLLDDKSQVKLRENSEVGITMVEDIGGPGYHVRLEYGQALTKYEKGAEFGFQLHTPTSVASIKGTEFWTVSDPETGDQIIVTEGQVDVMNTLTGMISTAGPGETVSSTTDGYIQTSETEEGTIPEDPEGETIDAEEGSGDAESDSTETETALVEEEEPETDTSTGDMPPPPPSTAGETAPEPEAEEEGEEEGGGLFGDALAMDAALGAVTIDGQLYNQIALRPDISIGKLGVGLDIVLYMDENGDIRSDDWDDYTDIIDKIMYIRWGQPQDPLYIRVGTLENVVLGYGLFINGYNNMMEYPTVRKIGTHVGFTVGNFGVETMIANVKELVGLASLRGTYSLGKLKFGMTVASDVNQYLGFTDTDDDGRPDIVDDFPDNDSYWLDSDGDGYADRDPEEYDLDGDNKTDNHYNPNFNFDDAIEGLKAEPFNLAENKASLTGVSLDIGYPVFSSGFLDVMLFAEAGKYMGNHYNYSDGAAGLDSVEVTHGWGFTAPGLRMTIMKIVNVGLEYRMTGENFVFSMFDQNYDIDRVGMQSFPMADVMKPITRDMRLMNTTPMKGVYGSVGVDVLSLVTVTGAYQHMIQEDDDPIKGIYGSINLAENLIPKLAGALAYINRMNVGDPWDIYSEGTLLGYKAVFALGGGATLTWDFRQTFRDLDGDGEINMDSGSKEVIKTTLIETGFSF